METTYASRDHGVRLPAIYIDSNNPSRGHGGSGRSSLSSPFSPALASIPMSIPNSSRLDAPPPLPPPRVVPVNGPDSIAAELYRPREREVVEDLPHYKGRVDRDEGYHSLDSPRGRDPFGSARFGVHHDQFQFKSSADAYDNSLLKKLNSGRARENISPPHRGGLSSSAREAQRPGDRFPTLPTLSLPTRIKQQQPLLDSPSRYTETPLHSAVSPGSTPFSRSDYRNGSDYGTLENSPIIRTRRTTNSSVPDDITVSTQGSYEMVGDDADFPMEETSRLQDFHIDSAVSRPMDFHTVGQKRRASSPPGDSPPSHNLSSSSELMRRRDGGPRGSPVPRLSVIPQNSMPSVSSAGRNNSYASNLSLTASSINSMNSFGHGRRSPGGPSPSGLSPTESGYCGSPYSTPMSLTTSPRSSISRTPHHRTLSEQNRSLVSPRKLTELPKANGVSKIQGFFMCDCCPKKPKKFETAEELSAHEAEKQYECNFCGNRFKNKNEAERHQNSLHVRRHSWSCLALSGYDRAFHESTNRPGEADTCGYCGEEFPRSGHAIGRSLGSQATDQDWEDRIRHLQDVHKFRECNSSKKFYRADHFRQHLKHSHAGTSGKWTNMLENACMLEEDPPVMPSR